MMDEPRVRGDKSWTDGSDTHRAADEGAVSRLTQEGHLVVTRRTAAWWFGIIIFFSLSLSFSGRALRPSL